MILEQKNEKLSSNKFLNSIFSNIFIYRYDLFSIIFMFLVIIWFMSSLFFKGHIVFSDIDIPFDSKKYMEEIFGLWNGRWSSPSMLNMPRLFFAFIPYAISSFFGFSGEIFAKSFILLLLFSSATTMYLFGKRLVSVYTSKEFNFFKVFALISGGLFYALNPWVVFRIQHIYLLCGYSLFPLVLMIFFNIFDPKFQKQLIKNYYIFSPNLYKKNMQDIIFLAIVFTFLSGGIHYFFYSLIYLPFLGVLLILKNMFVYRKYGIEKIKYFLLNVIKKIVWITFFFMLFNFFWFGMYLGSILLHSSPSQHNINVVDTLSMLSKNSSLTNVLYMISYWWPMFDLTKLPPTFYIGGGVIIFIIGLSMVMRAYKYNIVLMFSFLTVVFIILATGVELTPVADIFIKVTKLPVIGSMFRDPNKLVGILALNYGVLLIFGLELIFDKFGENLYGSAIKTFIMIIFIFSLYLYIEPLKANFIDGFYYPVTEPKEYSMLNTEMKKDKNNTRALYVPVADNMTQSYTGVATPFWNVNGNENGILKATGDIQIYNSEIDTVFHHEGNMIGVEYYYNFVQYLLDSGISYNLNSHIGRFSANSLIYANQYLGKEERQQFNLNILDLQKDMKKTYENNIFHVYKQNKAYERLGIFNNKIVTPYGYTHFESYNSNKSFDYLKTVIIPSAIEHNGFTQYIEKNDFIESSSKNDLFMSSLPEEYFIKPFEFINDGNVFLKWSKTFLKNSEWLWFMHSLDIKNFPFDFDYFDGVAVTFATAKLDVVPYKMKAIQGKLIADFDSLLKMEKFFIPDNPKLFTIFSNPVGEGNNFPVVHGEIVKGDPKNIWQVAKSGIIEVKENNPYKFNIKMSGRGTNKIHFKVRFFDNKMKELGISYVVAPGEQMNFNGLNFVGEFVSPKFTRFMRLDILSFQRPNQKAYWWIHDINLFDLERYKAKNVFKMEKQIKEKGIYDIYARVFTSTKGGTLGFKIGTKELSINTYSKNINQFVWKKLGTFNLDEGKNILEVENIEGFNAINLISMIPVNKKDELYYPLKKALEKSKIFFISEAENDFEINGNIQDERNSPDLSYGKGISLENGYIEKNFEVLKNDYYSFNINAVSDALIDNNIVFRIFDKDKKEIYAKKVDFLKKNKKTFKESNIIEYSESTEYDRVLKKIKNILNNKFSININGVLLPEGSYKMRIDYDSKVDSLSTFSDIHKFNPLEIKIDKTIDVKEAFEGLSCDRVSNYMMRHTIKNNIFQIEYDKTCSADWFVYASKKVSVEEENEYLVRFEAKSEFIKDRHTKVLFLDNQNKALSVVYINEVPEADKTKWNHYEQIVRAPLGAKKMLIQILNHGNRNQKGYLYIKDYKILPYKELILVDNVGVYEGKSSENFFSSLDKNDGAKIIYDKVDNMKTQFKITGNNSQKKILNFAESPSPMWNLVTDKRKVRNKIYVNSVTSGYLIDEDTNGKIEINLRITYYLGLILLVLAPIVSILILRRYKK